MGVCSPDPQADRGYSFSLSSPPTPAALRRQASWILLAEYGSLVGRGDLGVESTKMLRLGKLAPSVWVSRAEPLSLGAGRPGFRALASAHLDFLGPVQFSTSLCWAVFQKHN